MKQHSSELPQLTTTEELIVQYLDGELVRKELETMLFERLAQSTEARTLLREHLMMRGAIRSSMDHEMFQLSSDLDDRTRGRIEQMLQTIALETPAGVIPVREFAPDAPAVATNAATRSLKRWSFRPSLALLLLLLAVGSTWFITRSTTHEGDMAANGNSTVQPKATDTHSNSQISSTSSSSVEGSSTENSTTALPSAPASHIETSSTSPKSVGEHMTAQAKPEVIVHEVVRYVDRPRAEDNTKQYAQSTSASLNAAAPAKQTETTDPADVMISHRFAKMLNATAKHEVVVTSHDRL